MKKKIVSALLSASMIFGAALMSAGIGIGTAMTVNAAGAGSLSMWFDHSTVKTAQSSTESTGMGSYHMYMAKNEIECFQFLLAPAQDMTVTVESTDFTDGKGNTLQVELFYQHYFKMVTGDGLWMPDAIPPVAGELELEAGESQGFIGKVKTTADTVAGDYTATVTVSGDGQVLREGEVTLTVWDFTLTEETPFDTAIDVSSYAVYSEHKLGDGDGGELYKIYYDFMLENRVSCYTLPYDILDDEVDEYLDNPRVTSFMIGGDYNGTNTDPEKIKDIYEKLSQNPEWMDKGYFYYVDEPTEMGKLNQLKAAGEFLETVYPGYQMISPYFFNIDVTPDIDQITFMSDYITLWCTKVNAWTPTDAAGAGVVHMVSPQQVEKSGTFADRMAAEVAGGDKSWVYYCWEPDPPYTTFDASRDTIEQRVSMWQAMDNDATGLLYFTATEWTGGMWRTINKTNAGGNIVYGDGILIYPGYRYGIHGPISSMRFESIRDGIEDYMYLDMAKELLPEEIYDYLMDTVTVDVLNWTKDSDSFYNTRLILGNLLENAVKGDAADATAAAFKGSADFGISDGGLVGGVGFDTTALLLLSSLENEKGVSVVRDGEALELGDGLLAGDSIVLADGTVCGKVIILGDADSNKKINLIDASAVMKYAAKWESAVSLSAADANGDGKVNLTDASLILKNIAGWDVKFTKTPVDY